MKKSVKKENSIKKNNYFDKIKTAFQETRFSKRFFLVFILDLFYSLSLISLFIFSAYAFFQKASVAVSNVLNQAASEQEMITQLIISLAPFMIKLVLIAGALYAILFIFLKGTIWRKVLNQKLSFKYYGKLIIFNLIALVALVILVIITAASGILFFLPFILLVLLVHFYYISLVYLSKDNLLLPSIKKGFKKGWKIWLFAVPYLILLVIYFARSVLTGLFSFLNSSVLLTQLSASPTLTEIITFMQEAIQNFPKTIPFIIIAGIIASFFRTYSRIFYAEFVKTQ